MKPEETQALTGLCKIEIKRWEAAAESDPNMRYMVELMEVALAALTAQPRYQIQKKPSYGRESVWIDVASREEAETNVLHGYRWRMVYDCPALPVSLAELVPDDTKRMDWLVSKAVNVREPLPYGSHNIFWSQQTSDDCDENYATDLREQIDSAMRNIEGAK